MDRLTLLACALLVALAGCGGGSFPVGSTPTATDAGSGPAPPPVAHEVTVTTVVDGDTVRVAYPNGTADTVRLVGIDTPEVRADNAPGEFEGVPDTDAGRSCLRTAGTNASAFATDRLLGRTVGLAVDPDTDRRDVYDRLLAYVVVDDRLFNYRLVAAGHARVYDSDFSRADQFFRAERAAREANRGLWRCTDPGSTATDATDDVESALAIVEINYDAAGDDGENLNDEFVVIENRGSTALDLSGWTVNDEAGHRYTFDGVSLDPGERLTLHTGSGRDTQRDRYWGRDDPVWNNDGDTVTVRRPDGAIVAEQRY